MGLSVCFYILFLMGWRMMVFRYSGETFRGSDR